jgi:hypothetical protein
MNIILLVDILWIVVCSGGIYYGRANIPGGPLGAPIGWLLMVVLGIILIHLLLGSAVGVGYRPL